VLSPENYELREATLNACHHAGFTPRVVLDGGEMDTLLRLVASGLGITIVPRLAVQNSQELAILHIEDQTLQRSLGLVWRGDRIASPAARALREFLMERLMPASQPPNQRPGQSLDQAANQPLDPLDQAANQPLDPLDQPLDQAANQPPRPDAES
jgi:hypothetical protein